MPVDLQTVHSSVLSNFTWKPDSEVFGKPDHWDRPVKINGHLYGDCDDFSIECYYRLKDLGYAPELAYCITETGGGHLVCLCGQYVLDNRERRVRLLKDMWHYKNWKRSNGAWNGPWISFRINND